MALKSGIGIVTSVILLALLSGCRSDGDNRVFSKVVAAVTGGQQAPVITGSPKTTVAIGEKYTFRPRAHSPENASLKFDIANQPRWSRFDDATGQLAGEPTAADVGTYENVTISVTDGASTESLPAFDIKVVEAAPTPDPTPPTTPPPAWTPEPGPSAGSAFEFTETPEIVFVRGYAETEHMGIFQLDTQNRWTPGDLDNSSGWKPRIQTQLVTESGSLKRCNVRSCHGRPVVRRLGQRLRDSHGVPDRSDAVGPFSVFNVRVLQPTMVWASMPPGASPAWASIRPASRSARCRNSSAPAPRTTRRTCS